jgi:hypothetical protein
MPYDLAIIFFVGYLSLSVRNAWGAKSLGFSFLESQHGRVISDNIRNHPGLPSELYLRHSCTPESGRGVGTWRGYPAYLRGK